MAAPFETDNDACKTVTWAPAFKPGSTPPAFGGLTRCQAPYLKGQCGLCSVVDCGGVDHDHPPPDDWRAQNIIADCGTLNYVVGQCQKQHGKDVNLPCLGTEECGYLSGYGSRLHSADIIKCAMDMLKTATPP